MDVPFGIAVLASLVPYSIRKKHLSDGKHLTIQAISWSLSMTWQDGKSEWAFYLPLCERVWSLFHTGSVKAFKEQVRDSSSESAELPPQQRQGRGEER